VPADDPIRYYQMEAFRAYPVEAFLSGSARVEHPFTAGFLAPLGMDQLLICRVAAADGLQAWLSITRAGAEAFSPGESRRLEQIARLFGHALTAFGRLKTAEDQRDAYARAVRAHATGLIQLDQEGTVLHLDEQARVWITEATVLRLANGRLTLALPSANGAFDIALRRIVRGQIDEEFLVVEGRNDSFELLIYRAAEPFEPAWTHGTRALIYLTKIGREIAPSLSRLTKLFGFTPREASLARLLASGWTVSDAAAKLGISEQTARAYLRQIFQKAGVSRQAELVRRVQGSLAAIE
jgi:DNA-binding CsgD family transcriptional regulator